MLGVPLRISMEIGVRRPGIMMVGCHAIVFWLHFPAQGIVSLLVVRLAIQTMESVIIKILIVILYILLQLEVWL